MGTMWCGLLFYQEGLSPTIGILLTIVIVIVNVVYMAVIGCFLIYHTLREQASVRQCTCLNRLMVCLGNDAEEGDEHAIEMMNPSINHVVEAAHRRRHFSIKHNLTFHSENPLTWDAPTDGGDDG